MNSFHLVLCETVRYSLLRVREYVFVLISNSCHNLQSPYILKCLPLRDECTVRRKRTEVKRIMGMNCPDSNTSQSKRPSLRFGVTASESTARCRWVIGPLVRSVCSRTADCSTAQAQRVSESPTPIADVHRR